MTDLADGNSVTMSAAEDISLLDRPEGFVSSRLSPCSNTSLGGINNKSIDPGTEVEVVSSVKVTPVSNTLPGEAVADHNDDTLLTEVRNVSVGADDSRNSLGCPRRDFQGIEDSSIEEAISKTENLKDFPAVEISAVKISAVEISTVETPAVEIVGVETSTPGQLPVDTPTMKITTAVKAHAIEASTGEAYDMDVPVSANLEMEATSVGDSVPLQDLVKDGVENLGPDVRNIDDETEDVILNDMSADKGFGGEQESLPRPFKSERRDVASEFTPVIESPSTGNEDAGQQLRDSGFIRNGETRMDGAAFATNRSVLSITGATRVGNEVNSITDYTIGTTVQRTFEKFAEDAGDKLVDKVSGRMANTLADGVADRMADAIADEIADQIADRMADEIADKMADEMADELADEMADELADVVADDMADRMADEMASRMADEMADRMADRMADEMADRMADEMTAKMADELADEVIEGDYGRAEGVLENQRMDGETLDACDMEEEMAEDANKVTVDDDYEDDEGTAVEQMSFVEELERFFKQRNLDYKAPKFYGLELNVLKLWRVVSRYGGYDHVTVSKLWRTVGEEFKPPKTCTTISWSFRGFYEKALLDYERFKTGVSAPDCSQRAVQITSCGLANPQRTASPATPSSELNMGGTPGSGSGRARRDAAARAMQGWHSQRMGNGDSKEPIMKDKGSGGKYVKKEKKLTNIDRSCGELPTEDSLHLDAGGYGLKRKGSSTVLERAVKAVQARGRPRLYTESLPSNSAVTGKRSMKQQDSGRRPMKISKVDGPMGDFDPPIVDEGPKADWVKINVHKHLDCFEIYALVPGLAREEVRIQCEPGGRLVIAGMPEDPENPWGVTPFRKVISLPSRIDAHQTSAVVTLYGQLYVRVPIAEDDKSS